MRGEDVKEKIKMSGSSLKEVADKMKISPQALQNLLKTEDIKTGVLKEIANAINKSVYYFYEDLLDSTINIFSESKYNYSSNTTAPLITQYAHGGYLKGYSDKVFMDAQPTYVASKRYSGGNYVAFVVRGDSMDDGSKKAICNGDEVLGKELQKHYWTSKLHIPKVFVIVHRTEGITIKEIIAHDVKTGSIICHPYNSEHEDFELNLNEVVQLFYIKEIKRDV